MGGLADYESGRFRLPKSLQEDSLFAQSNPKRTQYKNKQAVEVFRNWQAVREQKFPSVDPGSMFKGVYLGVKTCEVFLCFVTIMFVLSFVLTSLFSLFYVTRVGDRFLHRG